MMRTPPDEVRRVAEVGVQKPPPHLAPGPGRMVTIDHLRFMRSGAYRRNIANEVERLGEAMMEVQHSGP